MNRRKERIRQYKQAPKQMGVYRIHNTVNAKALVAAGRDVKARLNRHRAELKWGKHPNALLQADWNEYGAAAFVFETLDTLSPSDAPDYDPSEDLQELEALWVEKLQVFGAKSYS